MFFFAFLITTYYLSVNRLQICHYGSGVTKNWSVGVQIYIFTLKFLFVLRLSIKSFKIQLYLVLGGLGLGVQMPNCTPLGYATALWTFLQLY
jgi:hypothetical protein